MTGTTLGTGGRAELKRHGSSLGITYMLLGQMCDVISLTNKSYKEMQCRDSGNDGAGMLFFHRVSRVASWRGDI